MKRQAGFTLMELMIAVVIIGILTAIALPSYNEYIRKSARSEARSILMEDVLALEQLFTLNNSYGATAPTPRYTTSPKNGATKYNIVIDSFTSTTYVMKAVPVKPDRCGTFIIDNTGLRSLGGDATATVAECWGG